QASPQLYLSTLSDAACCTASDMFFIAYDPQTDFTLRPWLESHLEGGLGPGEAVGGAFVFVPPGEPGIRLYGSLVSLKGNLAPTGAGLDQSLFITFDTARQIAAQSLALAEQPLVLPQGQISAVMVRAAEQADPQLVALEILRQVPGVTPVASPNLFKAYRAQLRALQLGAAAALGVTLALSLGLIGLVFSMAANERRREMGVLRALGATPGFVFGSLVLEAGVLALLGGMSGAGLTLFAIVLFKNLIISSLGLPFLAPGVGRLLGLVFGGLAASLAVVVLAAALPAYRVSRMDPAQAMRE
ncbi:MAG: ABC transporter permease, partial [Chloroflexota bacterium]